MPSKPLRLPRLLPLALASVLLGAVPVSAQSISEALVRAYDYAPDLQSALLSAKSAAEGISQAQAGMRPTIGASVGGTYNWSVVGGNFNDGTSLTTGLSYNQTIFDNGRTNAQIEAAQASAEIAEWQIRTTEQTVLLAVIQAYMSVLSDRQLVSLRQDSLEFYRAQLQSANDRLEVGEGTRIDVAQAQARMAQGEASYRAAVSSLEISQASFARYIGAAPGQLSASHGFGSLVPLSLDAAIAEAEAGHPALRLAKAAIRAAQAGSDAASSAFGPTASLTGSVGSSWTGPSGGVTDGFSGSVGVSISVPIYAGGAIGSSVRQANIEQIRSEVDAMGAYDQVREAVISAWAGIQSADAQITSAGAAANASQEVLSGTIQERDLGTQTTLDVLDAQSELITAKEAVITASANKVIATFSLLSAMGRLTAADLGLPVAIKTAVPYTQAVDDVWQELRSID